ncbi:MAG TPA: hypothetical protein VE988_13720, partial [Gemmataceae bacterium]|nr:hypothetical protein [Gemmataceae bacterium]
MTTLSELIGRSIKPETKAPNNPTMKIVAAQIQTKSEKPHDKYEADVFNYLLDNKDSLGIKSVVKFTALIVDGALELIGGKRLAIEIKYRMNWEKACQAEWQFRKFLTRHAPSNPVDGGVVFFEDISGDWNRKAK